MAGLRQFFEILVRPDNIPIAGMFLLVLFFTWVALKQALRNDRLIEQGREDEILKEMQKWRRVVAARAVCWRHAVPRTSVAHSCPGCTACDQRCPTRAI